MGTGYTTLDPSRRKVPPLIDNNDDEASTELEPNAGDGLSSLASSHAIGRGISDDRRVTSGGRSS